MMHTDRVCARCGRPVLQPSGPGDGSLCEACGYLDQLPPRAPSRTAADFLLGKFAPGFKGRSLSARSVIAVGIVTAICAVGFGALGVFALSPPYTGLPRQFGYGMLFFATLCVLGSVACFVPSSRWWVLPLLACLIGALIVVAKVARLWRPQGA